MPQYSLALVLLFFGQGFLLMKKVNGIRLLAGIASSLCLFGQGIQYDAYLKSFNEWNPPGPTAGDHFGLSVAVSGGTVVIGSPWEDATGEATGGLYVFQKTDSGFQTVTHLVASNPILASLLGASVAISTNTIIAGAPGNGLGTARIFDRNEQGEWTEGQIFSGPSEGSSFGSSVAIDGDTAVVTSSNEATGSSGAGACHVYQRSVGQWTVQARLTPQTDSPWQVGGASISGNTLVFSGHDAKGWCAFVFNRTGGEWVQQGRLAPDHPAMNDHFGASVAISGNTIAVGAPNAEDTGAVYVFVRDETNWARQAVLRASNADPGDSFGNSVALQGHTLVIGAGNEGSSAAGINGNLNDNSLPSSGCAYLFRRTGRLWSQEAYLKAFNPQPLDQFGASVAINEGILAVGSIYESSGAGGVNGEPPEETRPGSGAAYVFAVEPALYITSVKRIDGRVTLEFEFTPQMDHWQILTAHVLPSVWTDDSTAFVVTEVTPGHYKAESNAAFLDDATFFRIAR